MESNLIVMVGWLGVQSAALAQAPLEPVQRVYPDSTLEEIQGALDNGGTVYFERLSKAAGEYGEYNQIASSTPDLPPTAANPAKSFNIGVAGKDVDIIGVLGPNGERPRINGGTPVFSAVRVRINFKIQNLEMFNPDMQTAPGMYSRIGVWVLFTVGARSTVDNCKITITGKDTDTAHAGNHSVGIWFYLMNNAPQPRPAAR